MIVKPKSGDEISESGILIPESAGAEAPYQAEVVFISKAIKEQGEVKVGDTVLFSRYSGDEIEVDEVPMKVLHKESLLAVYSGDPKKIGSKKKAASRIIKPPSSGILLS